jgi:hypothetical protein
LTLLLFFSERGVDGENLWLGAGKLMYLLIGYKLRRQGLTSDDQPPQLHEL